MPRAALPLLLGTLIQAAPAGLVQNAPAPLNLVDIQIQGGSESDRLFARRALGNPLGGFSRLETGLDPGLETALIAVRATDRFRQVRGRLEPGLGGQRLLVELDPWPRIREVVFRGDEPISFRDQIFPGIRKGTRPGEFRIRRWVETAQQRLKEAGYPQAQVRIWREDGDVRLVAEVQAGTPMRIAAVRVEGHLGPYSQERLLQEAGVDPGRTIWTPNLLRQIQVRLRRRFVKDDRLEGWTKPVWDEKASLLTLKVEPGPRVKLRFEGEWSWAWKRRGELVPVARAGNYSSELLNEGDQHILHYLRGLGYLNALVTHRREDVDPDTVHLVYVIHPGRRVSIDHLRFEGHSALSRRELIKAAALPSGFFGGAPAASPDLIGRMEDRVKALYWSRGYPDVALRKEFKKLDSGKTALVLHIREKNHRAVDALVLEAPDGDGWRPWELAESLALILCERPDPGGASTGTRTYQGDRSSAQGVTATLEEGRDEAKPGVRVFTLTPSRPLPFIRNDLALVFSELRQRAASQGSRPVPRPTFEEEEGRTTIRFAVPAEPPTRIHRVVIQGSDETRAEAVFRELRLEDGMPMAPEALGRAQSNLSAMGGGVFQRLELTGMKAEGEGVPEAREGVFQEGDLLLRGVERSPWSITSAFGYDKSQGYHVGLGLERMNVGGMGRSLDFGIRAGDGTIRNPTLRRLFPTGQYDRSVDVFSLGYTDPWFKPDWLPERTRFRTEAAYLEEHQDVYLLHRRRLSSEIEWRVGPRILIQTGYRFERSDVTAAIDGILDSDLELVSRSPERSVISAPFFQISRDTRDSVLDPKEGSFASARFEAAAQVFGTGNNCSFLKLDLRYQRHWAFGEGASHGIVTFGARVGAARPTANSSQNLPLSERFFAGGPSTHRGVEPDTLGPFGAIVLRDPDSVPPYQPILGEDGLPLHKSIPLGGQGLALLNLEYRFPLFGQSVWGEVFVDSGQVYQYLDPKAAPGGSLGEGAAFPPFRTALGLGVILKVGLPIKLEYAADLKRILGRSRTQRERDTQLKGLLISAGFQF